MNNKIIVSVVVALLIGGVIGYGVYAMNQSDDEEENEQLQNETYQSITTEQSSGNDVKWILPGKRELDEKIFGTPEDPLGFEHDIGVPLDHRLTNAQNTSYTTTAGPTPHSDNFADVTGSYSAEMMDKTPLDTPESNDEVQAEFEFTDPKDEHDYRVKVKKLIPVGPDHPFFGGVIVDGTLHGTTGFGTKLQPTQYVYGAFWGVAELYIDGNLVSDNRVIHVMASEEVRDENYELMMDHELPHEGIMTHMILPNLVATPDGPQEEPVPSQFTLPNGNEQPFLHIMYNEPTLEGLEIMG